MEQQREAVHTFRDLPAEGVSAERLSQVIEDAGIVTGLCGATVFIGSLYEDAHIKISRTSRQIYITLKRPDESGDDETEVFEAYNDGDYGRVWTVSATRVGAWMDYVSRLAEAARDYDSRLNDRAAQMVELAFAPVKDDDLAAKQPGVTEQQPDELQTIRSEIYELRQHIDRRLSKPR